jgi:hypothetical protein
MGPPDGAEPTNAIVRSVVRVAAPETFSSVCRGVAKPRHADDVRALPVPLASVTELLDQHHGLRIVSDGSRCAKPVCCVIRFAAVGRFRSGRSAGWCAGRPHETRM